LINRNDYTLRLFNGDVGITLPDPGAGNELRVFFPGPEGNLRKFPPLRLPEHETVFAMTVHKSQGSEFEKVLFLMPDRDVPVLTRELIYTAITRAKEAVEIWGKEQVFKSAVSRRISRASGLRDALWG
jgi:exodeoxyribonuclease V alpha subunit